MVVVTASGQYVPRWLRIACLLACLSASANDAVAQAGDEVAEYNIKAAFLYKFATYVEWPPEVFPRETSPLVFGVMGADLLADQVEDIVRGRRIGARVLRVRRLDEDDTLDGLHVLFVGEELVVRAERQLYDAASRSVLTVTEGNGHDGYGVINFLIIEDRVKFTIALPPAERGNLRVSSRLLQVAHEIARE